MSEFFNSFYDSASWIYQAICDGCDDATYMPEINFDDSPIQELTTISASQPISSPCAGNNKCALNDYFDAWINETSSKVFSQTSRKKLYQKGSYSNWYDVFEYMTYWWTGVIKRVCYVYNSIYEKLQSTPEVYPEPVKPEEVPFFKSTAKEETESTAVDYGNFVHSLLLYFIFAGICLIVILLYRRRSKAKRRKEKLLTSLELKKIEINIMQKLIDFVKESQSSKSEFGTNYCTLTDAIKSLKKKPDEKVKREQIVLNSISPDVNTISKLEKQCKSYQNQIRILEKQLRELLKNHRAEIKSYFVKNRKMQLELGKSQNWLDLSHELHKTEAQHLQEYIAQLQGQYRNHCIYKQDPGNQPQFLQNVYSNLQEKQAEKNAKIEEFPLQRAGEPNLVELTRTPSITIPQWENMKTDSKDSTPKRTLQDIDLKSLGIETPYIRSKVSEKSENAGENYNNREICDDTGQKNFVYEDVVLRKSLNKLDDEEVTTVSSTSTSSWSQPDNTSSKKKMVDESKVPQKENTSVVECLKAIEAIFEDARTLKDQIQKFSGNRADPTYLRLKGHLIDHAIQVNDIEAKGYLTLSKKTKKVWRYVSKCRDLLESKISK